MQSTPMPRLPQGHGNPRVDHQNIHQVTQYNTPLSPWVSTCKTYINCSQTECIQSDTMRSQKERFNSSEQDSKGRTPYDPTILTKPMIHQDCDISRTREREIKKHSYWYIPSAPRENYSLLAPGSVGMMKMATGDDFPSQTGY